MKNLAHSSTVVIALAALSLLASCGKDPEITYAPDQEPTTTTAPASAPERNRTPLVLPKERPAADYPMSDPPQFHVLTAEGQSDLLPWTICGPGYCADGFPDDKNLPKVGAVDLLEFGFDLSGWRFNDVTFRELDVKCPRRISVAATKTGERTFEIPPAGPAGRWAVDIFGRGPGGDAVTTVEWTTSQAGESGPPATGVAAVLAGNDGAIDSYGVELSLQHLDRHYDRVAASITVASAEGRSIKIALRNPKECYSAGDYFFTAPSEVGREATTFGSAPFTYTAIVRLGDTTYTGQGTWPQGVIKGNSPNVGLDWTPDLPGYATSR